MAELPPREWDALVDTRRWPFLSHAWLAGLELTGCVGGERGWLPRPLLVKRGGELVAAAPAYLKGNSEGEFVFDHGWHRFASRLGVAYLPKLLVAVPFTPATGPRLLVRDGEPPELRVAVASALLEVARELGLSGAHALFLGDEDLAALEAAGFVARLGVQFQWHRGDLATYEQWLASFDAKRRHQIKRERRLVVESGVTVRTYGQGEIGARELDAIEAFYLSTVERFSPWTRRYLNRSFFDHVARELPHALELVLAEDRGRPVAGALNVRGAERLWGRYWGALEERPFLHFEVCYYHSIARALALGLSRFEPGAGGDHKLPRGFAPTVTKSAHWLADPRLFGPVRASLVDERRAVQAELARFAGGR